MNEMKVAWVPVAKRLQQIAALDAGKPRKHFLILGAGTAGLVAAYELEQLGHSVAIIEATERVGGRIRTHRFSSGQYGELGAMRVPGSHDYTLYYIGKAKLNLRPFVDTTPRGFFSVRGIVTRREDALNDLLPHFALRKSERRFVNEKGIGAILSSIVAEKAAGLSSQDKRNLFDGNITNHRLRQLDATSLRSALKGRWSSEAIELLGTTTSVETLWSRPLAKYVRDALTESSLGMQEIVGGMNQLPRKIAAKIRGTIKLCADVLSIRKLENDRARIVFSHDGKQHQGDFDRVLCTLPFGVLRRMQLEGLSVGKMRAIRNMSYVAATKVLLHCRSRFWETQYGIVGGRSVSDGISRQTYYPSDNVALPVAEAESHVAQRRASPFAWGLHSGPELSPFFQKRDGKSDKAASRRVSAGPGVLLGSYAWGADARRMGAVAPECRARIVMANLARFHPEVSKFVDEQESIDWEAERWSAGAYADLLPSDLMDYYHDAIKPEGCIHFAGEHLSPFPGWIQGAIYSSLRVLLDLVK